MSMLDMLEKEINKLNLFEGNMPEIVKAVADSIPSQTIPQRMKIALAMSEIMLFTSQFRINIQHWNGSIIPINSIMFCIAKSGASKDSSLRAARKCFQIGYDRLNYVRQDIAVNRAIEKATEAGCDVPDKFAVYKDYYVSPNPLFAAISTAEGFIQHLNDLSDDGLGAGYIFSGEVGAELATNINLTECIKLISELYDEGSKEVKIIKTRETQSKEIKNLPVSALFIGSQDNLLYDEAIKKKFKTEFTTKLARRSFFVFVYEDMVSSEYGSIQEMLKAERVIEDRAVENRKEVSEYIEELTPDLLKKKNTTIKVSEEVRDLFGLYKRYNEAVASTIDNQFPITKLTRTHLQWKALKLSGALALVQGYDEIELDHYKAAVEFVELINDDVLFFEKELVKEPYELFADYAHKSALKGTYTMNLHALRKAGFIPIKGQSDTHMRELVKLVNSYDQNGTYRLDKDTIYFTEIVKTDKILLSFLPVTGTKQQRGARCASGYECEELEFADLEEMLEGDYAYSPFKFLNGVRGKENICSPCKWVVLDVDTSEITDAEAHIMLTEINHFIVRTSNKNNPNKFRVILELDAEIDIPDNQWQMFTRFIAEDLGLIIDNVAKSQIFFSYAGRDILKTLDASPLATKPFVDKISDSISRKPKKEPSRKECSSMLDDPFTTFQRAFDAPDGQGRRRLIWAARYAQELGCTKEYAQKLVKDISDYWVRSLPEKDLDAMVRQIDRWHFD